MQESLLRLAGEAGAEVRRGVRVVAVLPGTPPTVTVHDHGQTSTLQARLVVGADGRASRVRGWGGFTAMHDADCRVIAGTLLEGTPAPDDTTYTVRGADGFVLMAPLGHKQARVYFMFRKTDDHPPLSGENRVPEFLAACRGTGAPAEWFDSATVVGPLAQFNAADHWVEHPARRGVVLLGDAAAASDPCYGCGLSLALMGVRHLRDCLLSSADWDAATEQYARAHQRYYRAVHRITKWLTELRFATGPAADKRRARVLPRLAAEPARVPDFRGLGPEAPSGEETRRFLLGED